MVLGSDAWHIISAQSRGKVATVIFFVGMWCITLPLCGYFVFYENYNLQALGAAVVIGYGTIAFVLLYLVFTSNWEKISMKAISKGQLSANTTSSSRRKKQVELRNMIGSDQYTIMNDDFGANAVPPLGLMA